LWKFTKYLSRYGWEPIVLTTEKTDTPICDLPIKIEGSKVYTTKYFALNQLFSTVKPHSQPKESCNQRRSLQNIISFLKKLLLRLICIIKPLFTLPFIRMFALEPLAWYKPGLRKGIELIKEYHIDLIFSSYGPSTSHLIASSLQNRTRLPWIAEFRDAWSFNANVLKIEPLRFSEMLWEKCVIKNAIKLVSVSEPIAHELEKIHSKKVSIITNGFDEVDYQDSIPQLPIFTITYTGSIYPKKQNPSSLFKAIAELKNEGILPSNGFEVRYFGRNVASLYSIVEKYNLAQIVKIHGFVSFKESIRRQKESTVLLLLTWNDLESKGVYTAKVFEYLGAYRPILAIGLKGDVIEELLSRTSTGIFASTADEIKSVLITWFSEFSKNGKIVSHFKPKSTIIKQYTRERQAKRLADLFNEVVNNPIS